MHNKALDYLTQTDAVLKQIVKKYGTPFIPSRPEGFETLCKLILEQQVSLASAKACFLKVKELIKEITPSNIISCTNEALKCAGVSRQKCTYLKALAIAVLEKKLDLENLKNLSETEVRTQLTNIKGIGSWTTEVYLQFALSHPNIIPLGDIAVVNSIKELYQIENKTEMEELTKKWIPYKSMATFILWHYYLETRNRKPLVY